ncbi:MAG: CcdB family protein [Pseudomonadota bacterium]
MAQFDVFENPNRAARSTFPYVVVIQSDVSENRRTSIVAPIAPAAKAQASDRAILPVEIHGAPYAVILHGLAALPLPPRAKPMAALPDIRECLPRAIDYLFLGL